jgi:hypothetical protein
MIARAPLLIFLAVFAAGTLALPHTGVTDDDDFYLPAGHSAMRWVRTLVTAPTQALRADVIDAHWTINKEHPPVAKLAIGLGRYIGHELTGWWSALDAGRLGILLFFAWAAMLVFKWAESRAGPIAGLFAVGAFVLMPRVAFHGRVNTLDMAVAATTTNFLWVFWRRQDQPGWRAPLLMGLAFGLAMSTKLNAPFALIGCGLFFVADRWHSFRPQAEGLRLPSIPLWMVVIPVVGLAVQVALWPHLWVAPLERFAAYVSFHTQHYPIYLFYDGQIWNRPFAPWHAPFAYTWATVPTLTLFTGLVGIGALCRRLFDADGDGRFARFLGVHLIVAIGVVAFSPVPKYGGVKLFLPFFPLFAIACGIGFERLRKAWVDRLRARRPVLAAAALGALLLSTGLADSVRFFGEELSQYAHHVGGLEGATQRGYERQYYDVFSPAQARWLSANAAPGATVHFEPNHKEYVRSGPYLQRRGDLRSDLRLSGSINADLVILTHERRWRSFADLAERLASRSVLYEHRVDGVVVWQAYAR